jgi:predicted ferric reductase
LRSPIGFQSRPASVGSIVSRLALSNTPTSRSLHRADQSVWSKPAAYYATFAGNALLILGFWWLSSGYEIARTASDTFNGLGRVTGLLGTYLVLWQLLLMSRLPGLEHAFGLEWLAVLHKWNGYLAISLLLSHGVFQTLGYQLGDGKDVATQLADFIQGYQGLLAAIVALAVFLAVVGVSVTIVRQKLAYETWYFVHLYAYLAVLLAFSHQLATGVDFAGNPIFAFYWWLLYGFVIGPLVLHRVIGPLVAFERHRFRVQSVEKEGRGVFSIYVGGRDLDEFRIEAGQFALWRFLDGKRWWQAHPFSISAVPDGRRLRITVKNSGDFTGVVHTLKPGTPILLEGPFGKFTERPANRKVLLIAGGIGITPIRPLAEQMALEGFDVRLLYRVHNQGDLVFRRELDELANTYAIGVDYLLTESATRRLDREAWFRPQSLARLVPDAADREVYLCGPKGMMSLVSDSLKRLGVPPSQIRTEIFRLL